MKKILTALFAGLLYLPASACDICGCGTNNLNPFLFPYLSRNFIAIGYMHRSYHIYPADGMTSREYYNTISITGQYSLGKKWQIVAMLPYLQSKLVAQDGTKRISGLGDITLALNYKLLDRQNPLSRHSIIIGGGAKLATGSYKASAATDTDEQNFQLGTGSFDYLLNGAYRFSYKKWAFSTSASYKYTTQNKRHFRFGDVFSASEMAVYNIKRNKFSISPYLQLVYEKQMQNADDHKLQSGSDGKIVYAGGGVDISKGRFSLGINYQAAATQNLADHAINARPRLATQVSFTF